MADITKCCGENCHLRHTCYRYLAPSDIRQSYANFDIKYQEQLIAYKGYICDHYWNYENK